MLGDLVLMYKCLNKMAPKYLSEKFSKRSDVHERQTRQRDSLQIPLFKSAAGQRSFSYRAVNYWNNLNRNIKSAKTLKSFKSLLKKHFLHLSFNG